MRKSVGIRLCGPAGYGKGFSENTPLMQKLSTSNTLAEKKIILTVF